MSLPSKLLVHRGALTNMVRRIALTAGEITLDYFEEGGYHGAQEKGDGSPVTEADRKAEAHIVAALYDAVPGVPVIAEELVAEQRCPDIAGAEYVWFVDALDGTREFVAGGEEYTVNIALVKNKVPVLGVIYAPAKGEMYAGFTEEDGTTKALRWSEESDKEKDIHVRSVPRSGMTVMVSKSHDQAEQRDKMLAQYKIEKVIKRASSLKLCAIAAGKADLYPRFGPTCAWDIAAGHAILSAAGGGISDQAGNPLSYGLDNPRFTNPGFVAWGAPILEIS